MSEDIFSDEFDGQVSYEGELAGWVMGKCQAWRDHYVTSGAQRTASEDLSDLS
jgi:hypothetical protein